VTQQPPSAASRLATIARGRYTFGVSDTGEPYALPLDGPRVVRMLRGGVGSLRAELAAVYLDQYGTPPPQQALADALTALEGIALTAPAKALALRVAEHDSVLYLDLGDDTGEVVRIATDGWIIQAEAPVLFRRTALTAPLRRPIGGGDMSELWSLLNAAEDDRPLVVAYLVAALMLNMPHPILSLTGEQGTGKSTAAKILSSVTDPSTVQLRKPPRDLDSWTTAAVGSHVVAVDNLSSLPDWLSDALCRASTGDGDVRRRLYTDGDLHVVSFRRVVILNGIDLGAIRDDLADRLVTVELHRIDETHRELDTDLTERWSHAAPIILGGLLDLTVQVLAILPDVHLERSPRMADFARVLAAVDQVLNTKGVKRYSELAGELAGDAVAADPVLSVLAQVIKTEWKGAVVDLLHELEAAIGDGRPPKGWPTGARALATLLRRRAPSLRRLGWAVEQTDERSERGTLWVITPPDKDLTKSDGPASTEPSSVVRQAFRQASAPPLTCADTKTAQSPDGMTNSSPNLSVCLETREGARGVPNEPSSRHFASDVPVDIDCQDCGEPLDPAVALSGVPYHPSCLEAS
jgi:energy-coupling factor transporter ATP-binding protein EcfA2